jgi:hypothetical protein
MPCGSLARDRQASRIRETFRDALVEQRKFAPNGVATIGRGHHEQAVEQRRQTWTE